jgi:hypothetical protein
MCLIKEEVPILHLEYALSVYNVIKKKIFESIQCTLNSVLAEEIINDIYCIYCNKLEYFKHLYSDKYLYLYKTMF